MKLSLNEPNLSKLELKYVRDVIEKNWLSIGGNHTKIFEKKFSKYLGIKYSLAVQSGTAALHGTLRGLGVKKGDRVIIPNFTCNSNISSVSQCNAIPVIVEVEQETLGLDYDLVKKAIKKYRPKALQLVHVYGFPARDTLKIISLCKKENVKVIEDASEALGSTLRNKKAGTFGDVSVFSIRSEKMIGVGEGAVISTNSKKIYENIKLICSRNSPYRSSRDPYWKKYFANGEGYNYLLPHLLGAVGRAQIERFKKSILSKKVKVGSDYRKIFKHKKFTMTQKIFGNSKPCFWLNSVYFHSISKDKVIKLANQLTKSGIEIRPAFWPLNKLKGFKSIYVGGSVKVSEILFNKSLVLPSSYKLNSEDVKNIYNCILKNI
jgi:perosamine synthetase